MSPVMVAPLVALAALLVVPGRLPAHRLVAKPEVVAVEPAADPAKMWFVDRAIRAAHEAAGEWIGDVLRVP